MHMRKCSLRTNKSKRNMSVYTFEVTDISGEKFDWKTVEGKKIMIVNVASQCGLTPQYIELQSLYEEYKEKGFVIIGFPANDFAGQEPGNNEEIASFCSVNYGVTFPMMSKIAVTGKDQHPLYTYLTEETAEAVTWNFQKFLIDEKGHVIMSIPPKESPANEDVVNWLNS